MTFPLLFLAVVILVGTVGALAWWRIADHFADEEHKRFRRRPTARPGPPPTVIPSEPREPPSR